MSKIKILMSPIIGLLITVIFYSFLLSVLQMRLIRANGKTLIRHTTTRTAELLSPWEILILPVKEYSLFMAAVIPQIGNCRTGLPTDLKAHGEVS